MTWHGRQDDARTRQCTMTETAEIPQVFRGITRYSRLPSCRVSLEGIRKLFTELEARTKEAVDRHLVGLQRPAETPEGEFETLKERAKDLSGLTAFISGTGGEFVMITSAAAWDHDVLPDRVRSIRFDSNSSFRNLVNVDLMNRFVIEIDLSEPPALGPYNPWEQHTPNQSRIEIQGDHEPWVRGVHDQVLAFFKNRRKHREWFHSAVTYNLVHWFLGFPLAFWVAYRSGEWFPGVFAVLPSVLQASLYVYVVLLTLLVFRFSVGLLRWLFPLVEIEGSKSGKARAVVWTFLLGVAAGLVADVLLLFR